MGALPITAPPSPGPRRPCPRSRAPVPNHLWPSIFSTRGVGACSGGAGHWVPGTLARVQSECAGTVPGSDLQPGLAQSKVGALGSKITTSFTEEVVELQTSEGSVWPAVPATEAGLGGAASHPGWGGAGCCGRGWSLGLDGAAHVHGPAFGSPVIPLSPGAQASLSLSFY